MRVGAVVAGLMFFVAAPAEAQVYDRSGLYVGLGAEAALEDFDLGGIADAEDGFTVDAFIGYRVHPLAAGEFEFRHFENLDLELQGPFSGTELDVDGQAFMGNLRLYLPVAERIQPFVKGGLGLARVEIESSDEAEWGWQAGAGVDWYVHDSFALTVEGGRFEAEDDLSGFDLWTVGASLMFRF